jgi:hypothetical protein
VLCKSLQCSPGESPESNETSRVCVNVLILSLGLGRRACKPDTVHCRVKVCKSKRIKDVRTTDPMESGLAVSFRYQISPPSREIVESSQAVARVTLRRGCAVDEEHRGPRRKRRNRHIHPTVSRRPERRENTSS